SLRSLLTFPVFCDIFVVVFFFVIAAVLPDIYTLSLHDALPIFGAIVGKTAPSALSNAFIDTEHLLVDVTVVRVTGYAELSLWKRTIAQYFPHAIFFFMTLEIFSLPVSTPWRACNPGSARALPRRSSAAPP